MLRPCLFATRGSAGGRCGHGLSLSFSVSETMLSIFTLSVTPACLRLSVRARFTLSARTVRRGERVRPGREAADDATTGVEDVERDALILVLEPVIDHRAVGWVLPYGMRLVRREREATRPVDPVGVARLEEMRGFAWRGPH